MTIARLSNSKLFSVSGIIILFFFFSEPDQPQVSLVVKGRNGIVVTWPHIKDSKGPRQEFIGRLFEGDTLKEQQTTFKNKLEFRDLSYSTVYRVEVGGGRPRIFPSLNQCCQRFSVPPGGHI